ncbi:MAG: hypothetical protein M1833_000197 [Piccolia ochrophora]|nr:MAG: hypothetical protein M1833_000197 [Piccolia ochrophora]
MSLSTANHCQGPQQIPLCGGKARSAAQETTGILQHNRTRSRSIAQALFFVIREVNGHALQGSQGFLASIGQQPTPEILRVGSLGNLHPNNDPSTRAEWAQPAPHLRLFPNKPLATKPSPSTIDELINQVAGMKEDVTVLQEAIKEKEKLLRILTGEHSPQEHVPIKHCKNLSCAFNTMVDRAHNILKTVKVPVKSEWAQHRSHFRCNKHHHQHQGSSSFASAFVAAVAAHARALNAAGSVSLVKPHAQSAVLSDERPYASGGNKLVAIRGTTHKAAESQTMRRSEGVLEDAMQTEIRSLTNAARLVSSLVSSDGSASNTSRGPGTPVDDETPFSPPRGLHRSGSFPPDYRSEASEPPPIYDDVEEGAVEEFVADGFQYTPTGSCETPESSVVPTSEISERLEDEEWQKD